LFLNNFLNAGPLEAVSANAYAVAYSATIWLNEVEITIGSMNDDGARGLGGAKKNDLALEWSSKLFLFSAWLIARLVIDLHVYRGVGIRSWISDGACAMTKPCCSR
jgi:hypothetical protein